MRSTDPRRIFLAMTTLCVVLASFACFGSTAGAATTSSRSTQSATLPTGPLVPPAGTSLLGAMVVKGSKTSEPAMWNSIEAGAGNNVDLAQIMYQWGAAIPSWREAYQIQHGRIPMISWGWAKSTDVTSGKYDAYIRTTATGIKALGAQVFLRYFWEMDGKANAKYAVSPAAFIAAWDHIRKIFTSAGATNVVWLWTPTAYGFDVGRAAQWYPGNSQVDWVGADGFNWYPAESGVSAKSFAQIFSTFYKWGLSINKPMLVGATGALETSDPMAKANWIKAIATTAAEKRSRDPGGLLPRPHVGLVHRPVPGRALGTDLVDQRDERVEQHRQTARLRQRPLTAEDPRDLRDRRGSTPDPTQTDRCPGKLAAWNVCLESVGTSCAAPTRRH